MATESVNDEPTTQAAAPRRALVVYRRCLVGGVMAVMALTFIGIIGWRLVDQSAARREQRVVQQTLQTFGGSTPDSQGHVEQLTFMGSSFRPQALDKLHSLPYLTRVAFINVPLTDDTLARIARLRSVHELVIIQAPITDKGLAHLAECQNLTYLQLTETDVSGAGLRHLSGLTHLRRLYLKNNHVDDGSLKHLQNLTALERLYLFEADVSDDGVRELQIALPKTVIKR
jgi:hypothetical protein